MASLRPLVACLAGVAAVLPAFAHAAVDTEAPGTGVRTHNPDASWELDTSFAGRSYSINFQDAAASELSGSGERLRAELIDFLAPVRDDGTPYALQPFLQRTSSITVHVDLGHFETNYPFGSPLRTDYDANLGGGVSLYLRPWLNLFGNVSYDYDSLSDNLGIASRGDDHPLFLRRRRSRSAARRCSVSRVVLRRQPAHLGALTAVSSRCCAVCLRRPGSAIHDLPGWRDPA